jgi:aldose 1-epimerase
LPTGEAGVAGSGFDFSSKRIIGSTSLDTGYTDLGRGEDGLARVGLESADGSEGVTVWADSGFKYFMIYTADKVGDAARRRASIAIEPMTCPPNALGTGTSVIPLALGGSWRATWGISPR